MWYVEDLPSRLQEEMAEAPFGAVGDATIYSEEKVANVSPVWSTFIGWGDILVIGEDYQLSMLALHPDGRVLRATQQEFRTGMTMFVIETVADSFEEFVELKEHS